VLGAHAVTDSSFAHLVFVGDCSRTLRGGEI
jgi:hypothetical protein